MPEQEGQSPASPMAAPRFSCTEVAPGHLSATFGCQHPACSSAAALVELVVKGTPHPDDHFLHRDILEAARVSGAGQIIVKGFIQDYRVRRVTNYSMPLSPTATQQVAAGLRSGDPAALYELEKDYAPFYCTQCAGVFCALRYHLEEVWDEAGPDFWHGTCPYGHRKFIDH
ncbi:hypothetical protein KDH_23180 [Dictyobacter sp. S3.2.2.5]|uniref:Uncharacterized protein n=1 Tax=Dictyobacter halimunensis TaxID=3026934 RepID=A0ABQ6FMK6_9CHLR|nr:hypothetical protein KDH_23180 [Dictyobacter sp. S3.2.2.5]